MVVVLFKQKALSVNTYICILIKNPIHKQYIRRIQKTYMMMITLFFHVIVRGKRPTFMDDVFEKTG